MDQAISREMELAKGLQSLASAFKKTSTHEEPSVPTPETPAPSLEDDVAEGEGHHPDVEQQKQCLQALGETLLVNQQLLEKMEQQWQQAERQLVSNTESPHSLACCSPSQPRGSPTRQWPGRCISPLFSWGTGAARRQQSKEPSPTRSQRRCSAGQSSELFPSSSSLLFPVDPHSSSLLAKGKG
ncbi:uncharacterized protein [Struthio camelus]|uniref:uncharacterized protein isoform X2 n=1 Tax=Struthio camelus TaxID=8801 RepID=UPI003603D46F